MEKSSFKDVEQVEVKTELVEAAKETTLHNNAVNQFAIEGTLADHELTVRSALRAHSKAVGWALVSATCVIMEGYDTNLLSNFFAYRKLIPPHILNFPSSHPLTNYLYSFFPDSLRRIRWRDACHPNRISTHPGMASWAVSGSQCRLNSRMPDQRLPRLKVRFSTRADWCLDFLDPLHFPRLLRPKSYNSGHWRNSLRSTVGHSGNDIARLLF